jgi:hypothetical protein
MYRQEQARRQGAVPSASVDELAYPGVWESDMATTFVISHKLRTTAAIQRQEMEVQASIWVATVPM